MTSPPKTPRDLPPDSLSTSPGWYMHPCSKASLTYPQPKKKKTPLAFHEFPLSVLRNLGYHLQDMGESNVLRDLTASSSAIRDAMLAIAWEELEINAEDDVHAAYEKDPPFVEMEGKVSKEVLSHVRAFKLLHNSNYRLVPFSAELLPGISRLILRDCHLSSIGHWIYFNSPATPSSDRQLNVVDLDLRDQDWGITAPEWLEKIFGKPTCKQVKSARLFVDNLNIYWDVACGKWGSLLSNLENLTISNCKTNGHNLNLSTIKELLPNATFPKLQHLTLEKTYDAQVEETARIWNSLEKMSSHAATLLTTFLAQVKEDVLVLAASLPSLKTFRAIQVREIPLAGREEESFVVFEWVIMTISRPEGKVKTTVDTHCEWSTDQD